MSNSIMAHWLNVTPATINPFSAKSKKTTTDFPSLGFPKVLASHGQHSQTISDTKLVNRRTISVGLAATALGLSIGVGDGNAAARRPPPPPPEEKMDPNVSGLQAKVLASKKRKEAMKQAIAKLREKGKTINEKTSNEVNEASKE